MSNHEKVSDMKPHLHETCPRDQDVDDWFDARFESMKDLNVEDETPMQLEDGEDGPEFSDGPEFEGYENRCDPDEVDEDDPLAAMMNMEGML